MDPRSPATVASTRSSSAVFEHRPEPEEHVDSPMRKRPRLGSAASRSVPSDLSSPTTITEDDNARRPSQADTASQRSGSDVTLDLRPLKSGASSPVLREAEEPFSQHSTPARTARQLEKNRMHEKTVVVVGADDSAGATTTSSPGGPVIEIEIPDMDGTEGDQHNAGIELISDMPLASRIIDSFPGAEQTGWEQAISVAQRFDKGQACC